MDHFLGWGVTGIGFLVAGILFISSIQDHRVSRRYKKQALEIKDARFISIYLRLSDLYEGTATITTVAGWGVLIIAVIIAINLAMTKG